MAQQQQERREIKFSFELTPKLYAMMSKFAEMKGKTTEKYCEDFMLWGTESCISRDDHQEWNEEKDIMKKVTFRIIADVELEVSKAQEECLEYAAKEMRCSSIQEELESNIYSGPQFDAENFQIHFEGWFEKFKQQVDEAYEGS